MGPNNFSFNDLQIVFKGMRAVKHWSKFYTFFYLNVSNYGFDESRNK